MRELKTKKARAYALSLTLGQIMDSHKHQPKQLLLNNDRQINKSFKELWDHIDSDEELESF